MTYSYRPASELYIVAEDQVDICEVASFLTQNCYDLIYVSDCEGRIVKTISTSTMHTAAKGSRTTVGGSEYISDWSSNDLQEKLDDFFFEHPDLFRCPVIKEGHLIGEYRINEYVGPNIQYKYNLFALKWFVAEIETIADFLRCEYIHHLCILAPQYYWEQLGASLSHLPANSTLIDDPKKIPEDTDYIINMEYPEPFRKMLPNGHIRGESLYEITEAAVLQKTITYLSESGIHFFCLEGPDKHSLKGLYPDEIGALRYQSNMPLLLRNHEYIKKVARTGVVDVSAPIMTNGIHFILTDYSSPQYNVKNGMRHTTAQPPLAKNTVHLFGPCIVQGFLVSDSDTIASCLQDKLNRCGANFCVVNHGINGMGSLLNSCLSILSTPMKCGEYVFEINTSFSRARKLIKKCNINFFDLSQDFIGDHYWFFNHPFHCNSMANKKIANRLWSFINPSETSSGESSTGISLKSKDFESLYVAENIQKYVQSIKEQAFTPAVGETVAAIVMTADPFTNGHLHLVETALKSADYLYVFVVEEDSGFYSFADRMEMVTNALASYSNIRILSTGELMHSVFTFPEYNFRGQNIGLTAEPSREVKLFGEIIAPTLGITMRFFGDEPTDPITRELNSCALKMLPTYGIDVKIVPRKKKGEEVISGSKVRKLAEDGHFGMLEGLVPDSTLRFLKAHQKPSLSNVLVSLIVPAYNAEEHLRYSLGSACAQTFSQLEIMVVDDGSEDRTWEIIKTFAKKDTRIKPIHLKRNCGLSAARNVAIEQATGKYIMFLDSDDQISSDIVQFLFDAAERTRADIAISGFKKVCKHMDDCDVVNSQAVDAERVFTGYEASYEFLTNTADSQTRPFCSRVMFKLFRRSLIGDLRFEVGRSHEDEFFTYKLYRRAARIFYSPVQRYFYLIRADSLSKRTQLEKDYQDAIDALEERNSYYKEPLLKAAALEDYKRYLNYILPKLIIDFPGSNLLDYVQTQLSSI